MCQDTSEECRTGEVQWGRKWGYSTGGGLCVGWLHAVLVYLTRSFPVPSQKHGL